MDHRRRSVRAVLAATAGFACAAIAAAQTVPASGRPLPRTADGRPDLSGVWQAMTTAHVDIEPHAAARDIPAGLGIVEGGALPYQPASLARREENRRNRAARDTEARCFLPGVPRIMYMPSPFQIVQTPTLVMMITPDHIRYTATITDPKVFTRPWTMNVVLYRHLDPNAQVLDYPCYAFELGDTPLNAAP
jgi:hypothetical protein